MSEYTPEIKKLRFLNRNKKLSTGDAFGLFTVITFGLHIITFFILLLLYSSYSQLNKKPSPSLVQLETGKSIKVVAIGSKERSPRVVSRFVSDTMILMMNANGTLPITTLEEAQQPKKDSGIEIRNSRKGGGKITTAAWQASTTFSEDFRKEFLELLAQMTPHGVFEEKTQMTLTPLSIQSPVKISEGKWKVKMVANLTIFSMGNNLGEVIPFNKEIFVQAVEAPDPPVKMTGLTAVIYSMRSSGLEIVGIRDMDKENL
ncbi:MAG: hypothetical protein ACFB02_00770 [Mastigocoleus sp.]